MKIKVQVLTKTNLPVILVIELLAASTNKVTSGGDRDNSGPVVTKTFKDSNKTKTKTKTKDKEDKNFIKDYLKNRQ